MWGNFGRVILTDRLSSEVAVSLLLCKKQSSIFPRTSPNWSPTNQKLAISFFPGKKNMHLSLPHFWGSWVPTNPGMPRPVHATYATSLQWHMMAYGFKLSFRIIWSQWSFKCSTCRTGRKWRHNMEKNIKPLLTRHFIDGMLVDLCVMFPCFHQVHDAPCA